MSSYTLSKAALEEIARRQLADAVSEYTSALNDILQLDIELSNIAGKSKHVKMSLAGISRRLSELINQKSPVTIEDAKAATAKMSEYANSIYEFLHISSAREYFALCKSVEDKIDDYRKVLDEMNSDTAMMTECHKLEKSICAAEAFLDSTPVIPVDLNSSNIWNKHDIIAVSEALTEQGEMYAQFAKIRNIRKEERIAEKKLAEVIVQHDICAVSVTELEVALKTTNQKELSKAELYKLIDILETKAVFPNDRKHVKKLREAVDDNQINTRLSVMSTISSWNRRENVEMLYKKYSVLASQCGMSASPCDSFMDYEDLVKAISEIENRLLDNYEAQMISDKLNETLRELGMLNNGTYKPHGREKPLSLSVADDGKYALLSSLHNNTIYLESAALADKMFYSDENRNEYMNSGCVMMDRIIKCLKEKGVHAASIHTCTDAEKIETLNINTFSSAAKKQKNNISIHAEVK